MNTEKIVKYSKRVISCIIIVTGVSIVSGLDWFATLFMILFALLLLGVVYKGIDRYGKSAFWGKQMKPSFAIPAAWLLLHIVLTLAFPNALSSVIKYHWKWLLIIEISVFVLNSVINKETPFEKRITRTLMKYGYILTLLICLMVIALRMTYANFMVNLDQTIYSRLANNKATILVGTGEKQDKVLLVEKSMDRIQEIIDDAKAEKRLRTQEEKEEIKKLQQIIKQDSAVEPTREVTWVKIKDNVRSWLSEHTAEEKEKPKIVSETKTKKKEKRILTGIYTLPPDGQFICRMTNSKQLKWKSGDRIELTQMNERRRRRSYWFINQENTYNIPSFRIHKKVYRTGRARGNGIIELMNPHSDRKMKILVRIIPS